jgi:peptidoglycan/xylan/chitin deacetylase (PgdA/CDA1 family)
MTRWDWTWEERSHRSPALEPDAATDELDSSTQTLGGERSTVVRPEHVFRRRRRGAGVVLVIIVAVLIAAISTHNGAGHAKARATKPHVLALSPSAAEQQAQTAKAENGAIDSVLAYTPAVLSGGSKGNEVALTFDDGPGPYTQRLVATLNRLGVHATFFTVGSQEQYFSAGTVDELNSGDVVGDHTETHPMMSTLSPHDQHEQLFEEMAQIELLGGRRPRLFRPPYGSFNATTFRQLHHLHLLMILWSVDTADYTRPGVAAIARRALEGARPGAIILMHDAGGDRSETIAALPAIVRGLRKRGLAPVTVPRLLLDDPPPVGQRIPTTLAGG